jgi:hypothetical protein
MTNKLSSLIAEINEMTRQELITAKQELIPDKDIPKHERSQLLVAIDSRLSQMKNFEKTVDKIIDKTKPREYSNFERYITMKNKTLSEQFLAAATFKAVCEIDSSDLENIITEFFTGAVIGDADWHKKCYESVAENEWRNDSQYSFNVSAKGKIYCGEDKLLESAKRGEWESLHDILTYLCKQKIVPECELIVRVCW